jgi:ubiquitin C-terminal hydrolase
MFVNTIKKDPENSELLRELSKLFVSLDVPQKEALAPNSTIVALRTRFPSICRPHVTGDVQELVLHLIDEIHKDTRSTAANIYDKGPDWLNGTLPIARLGRGMAAAWQNLIDHQGWSHITDLTYGQTVSQIECPACNYRTLSPEVFTVLALNQPMTTSQNLQECVDKSFYDQVVEGWKCDKCSKKVSAKKCFRLWKPPPLLVVATPAYLVHDTAAVLSSPKLQLGVHGPGGDRDWSYDLKSIACHSGSSLNYGHYTAVRTHKNGKWYVVDDDAVFELESIPERPPGRTYLAFYEMSSTFSLW